MWPLGALVAALVKLTLDALKVPGDMQWRIVLGAGAIPAFSVIYLRRTMPETARYLARLGKDQAEAARVMQEITGVAAAAPAADLRSFGEVFARHARVILSAALLWMVYDLVVYASILFGPSLIAQSLGIGPVTFSLLMQLVFTMPPAILMSLFVIDQFGRKPLQVWGFLASALCIGVFALMQGQLMKAPILALLVFGLFYIAATGPGIVSGSGVLGVELAPTRIRSVAQSITVAGGRIGAAISAFAFHCCSPGSPGRGVLDHHRPLRPGRDPDPGPNAGNRADLARSPDRSRRLKPSESLMSYRYWTLSGKPLGGWPQADTFDLREAELPEPAPGQALTRTIYVSLDPYQWGYKSAASRRPGAPCHARTVAQVVESRIDGLAPGDFVFNTNGWAEYGLDGRWRPTPGLYDPAQARPVPGPDFPGGGRARHAGPDRLCWHGADG